MTYEEMTTEQKIVSLQAAGFRAIQTIEFNQQQIQQINTEISRLNSATTEPVKGTAEEVPVEEPQSDPVVE